MNYRVILQPRAIDDLQGAYLYLSERYSTDAATEWYNRFIETLDSLSANPERCGLARESDKFPVPIRQLLFRRHRSVYRALFTVQDDAVRVLTIRHAAQRDVAPDDLEDG